MQDFSSHILSFEHIFTQGKSLLKMQATNRQQTGNKPRYAKEPNAYDGVPGQQDPRFGAFGATEERPGFWAKRAIECKWKRGLTASLTRGNLLYRLIKMPLRREPVLQLNSKNLKRSHPNSSQFDRQIGAHKTNIEALVGQAVGEFLDKDICCDSCANLDGKFANCVRVPGMAACPSCHYGQQGFRCSFAKDTKKTTESIPRKRCLEAMLEEMSDLYDLECKKLKQGEALGGIIAEKHRLAKAIMEEPEGVSVYLKINPEKDPWRHKKKSRG